MTTQHTHSYCPACGEYTPFPCEDGKCKTPAPVAEETPAPEPEAPKKKTARKK
jgi:hypothetical protein